MPLGPHPQISFQSWLAEPRPKPDLQWNPGKVLRFLPQVSTHLRALPQFWKLSTLVSAGLSKAIDQTTPSVLSKRSIWNYLRFLIAEWLPAGFHIGPSYWDCWSCCPSLLCPSIQITFCLVRQELIEIWKALPCASVLLWICYQFIIILSSWEFFLLSCTVINLLIIILFLKFYFQKQIQVCHLLYRVYI